MEASDDFLKAENHQKIVKYLCSHLQSIIKGICLLITLTLIFLYACLSFLYIESANSKNCSFCVFYIQECIILPIFLFKLTIITSIYTIKSFYCKVSI